MRPSAMSSTAIVACVLLTGACGESQGTVVQPTAVAPSPTPTPTPAPTPPIDDFAIVGSDPPTGGTIRTGVPSNGLSTSFQLTLSVVSAADRTASIHVFLESPRNGVCLENVAPDRRPTPPDVVLKAGVPVTLKIEAWRVTSVCFYPNTITSIHVRMMPSPDITATPIYEERFPAQYDVTL